MIWGTQTFALGLALAALIGCAGAGHRYGCDNDAGSCDQGYQNSDGGRPNLPSFLSTPVVVAHDGKHDGFADVTSFNGQVYAAYRRAPSRGYDGTAEVRIVRSADKGQTWTPSGSVALPGYDLRDPKLTLFKEKLLVSFTAWDASDPTKNRAFFRAALSSDGQTFAVLDAPSLPQPFGLSAWRPRLAANALLLPVWTADELFNHPDLDHVSLLRSTDGQSFPLASALPIGGGAEPELLVRDGGRLLLTTPGRAIDGTPGKQSFCSSTLATDSISDWTCWTSATRVETPLLYEWSGSLLLFGRHDVGEGKRRTAIWQVLEDAQSLVLIADLDTFGDTGAPGLLQLDPSTALLLYYTSSRSDPQAQKLDHEPTEGEAISLNLSADVMALKLYLPSAPIGN